jgi:hypothetical protein
MISSEDNTFLFILDLQTCGLADLWTLLQTSFTASKIAKMFSTGVSGCIL